MRPGRDGWPGLELVMSDQTKIEWADSTFNPWIGCTKVSPACDHCYAENMMDTRLGRVQWGAGKPRQRTSEANWRKPVLWNLAGFWECGECGWRGEQQQDWCDCPACEAEQGLVPTRRRVFCASLADVFDNEVPDEWREDLFALIHDAENLDFLLLTKRIGNVEKMLEASILGLRARGRVIRPWPWPNVWLGATVVNQAEADRDIPKLLATPAAVRFISVEPMLGPVKLLWGWVSRGRPIGGGPSCNLLEPWKVPEDLPAIDWVICGGESGKDARPMHPDWVRLLRDQCAAAGVPFLFKQWGEWGTSSFLSTTGAAVFRQFSCFQDWVNKASTRVRGGVCLDSDGRRLLNGADMARARDECKFPVTIMDSVGKHAAGRTLDGRTHDEFPAVQS